MVKGIDQKFVHYGIRRDDLSMIGAICDSENIDFEWLSEEILKAYHAKRVDAIDEPKMKRRLHRCGDAASVWSYVSG